MTIPSSSGYLTVSHQNQIYWETTGFSTGIPVLFLHGGPGSGLSSGYKNHFDPLKHYIISFDQRGCGRSTPLACNDLKNLNQNNTQNLIKDIEALRTYLKVDSMIVVGISFGSFLAISYAQKFPQHVNSMVLGAITTLCKEDIIWITQDLSKVFPLEWKNFVSSVSITNQDSIIQSYYKSITQQDSTKKFKPPSHGVNGKMHMSLSFRIQKHIYQLKMTPFN